ncbi:hypothetical protein WJX84_004646 [Apatococcus fuscideae]|uniref:Cilia- and flagella-associated protein 58 central coiled coil domain-containing protein n=1 Tax=Apatococcus fuscideae TaxID=2026836 RepID=A0AAW1SPV0_9CHLO
MEREYLEVIKELAGDQTLDRFRVEYEKLFKAVKKSHDNEKRLAKKCRELNAEIVANAAKVQTALKLSEEDQGAIAMLKSEIEKAWKMVDASHEKEANARELIEGLKEEISSLTQLLEAGQGLSAEEQNAMDELTRQRDALTKERNAQMDQIVGLHKDVASYQEKLRVAEGSRAALDRDVQGLRTQIANAKSATEKEVRRRERLEREAKDVRAALEARQQDVKLKQQAAQTAEEQCGRLEHMLRDSQVASDRVQKEWNQLNEKSQKLHRDLDDQVKVNQQLTAQNTQRQTELRLKDEQINELKNEEAKVERVKEATILKLRNVEKQKGDIEKIRDDLKAEIAGLERERQLAQRDVEAEKKKAEELARERDILTKLNTQAENTSHKHMEMIRLNENNRRTLEQEVAGYKVEARKQQKDIWQLERDKEKYEKQAKDSAGKHSEAMEQVELRELAIADIQKKISEGESRLKQQQNLYETVRADRNLYSKNLVQAQDEIQELKRKFKIMTHQIEQLKEEIAAKDQALVKEHFEKARVDKEREVLGLDMSRAKEQLGDASRAVAMHEAEISKLNHIIREADQERERRQKEWDAVMGERDILGTQLVRRNDELGLLYEKVKLQASTLTRGQLQYRDRLAEIRALRLKLTDLRRELHILRNSVANVDVLKHEVHHLGRELLQERTKVKALSEELENPLNVHRWRKLEGSDPTTYEMIQKVQLLQRRLIAKTEEVVEKDLAIQEREKLYVELKAILARQPGPEAAEQLSYYQATLREKTKQMKAMAGELNMHTAQNNEHRYEIERMGKELQDLKQRFFEQKRREQLKRERSLKPVAGPSILADMQKQFAGGGFAISQPMPA